MYSSITVICCTRTVTHMDRYSYSFVMLYLHVFPSLWICAFVFTCVWCDSLRYFVNLHLRWCVVNMVFSALKICVSQKPSLGPIFTLDSFFYLSYFTLVSLNHSKPVRCLPACMLTCWPVCMTASLSTCLSVFIFSCIWFYMSPCNRVMHVIVLVIMFFCFHVCIYISCDLWYMYIFCDLLPCVTLYYKTTHSHLWDTLSPRQLRVWEVRLSL